uniref:Uncharacterized protein n=1 Tax=Anguilla anguilla TaxID=7936 RepID=A0A0E9W8Y3_ANGAN
MPNGVASGLSSVKAKTKASRPCGSPGTGTKITAVNQKMPLGSDGVSAHRPRGESIFRIRS